MMRLFIRCCCCLLPAATAAAAWTGDAMMIMMIRPAAKATAWFARRLRHTVAIGVRVVELSSILEPFLVLWRQYYNTPLFLYFSCFLLISYLCFCICFLCSVIFYCSFCFFVFLSFFIFSILFVYCFLFFKSYYYKRVCQTCLPHGKNLTRN